MNMELKESVKKCLSHPKAKKDGLHVKHIARFIINENKTLFTDESEFEFEAIKKKVNALLLREVKKKKSDFKRIKNPKTNKFRKGFYKLKVRREAKQPVVAPVNS